jgi:hypothetical protein
MIHIVFFILQVDCLQVDGVLQRRNLVYCASTRYFPVDLEFILNFLSYYPLLILYFIFSFVVNTFVFPLIFQTHAIKSI